MLSVDISVKNNAPFNIAYNLPSLPVSINSMPVKTSSELAPSTVILLSASVRSITDPSSERDLRLVPLIFTKLLGSFFGGVNDI